MKKVCLIVGAILLAGCETVPSVPLAPATVADRTIMDEKAASGFELAYATARTLGELAVDTGRLKGERAAQVQMLNRRAYAALQVIRTAYRSGNSDTWLAATADFQAAVGQINSLAKGN